MSQKVTSARLHSCIARSNVVCFGAEHCQYTTFYLARSGVNNSQLIFKSTRQNSENVPSSSTGAKQPYLRPSRRSFQSTRLGSAAATRNRLRLFTSKENAGCSQGRHDASEATQLSTDGSGQLAVQVTHRTLPQFHF